MSYCSVAPALEFHRDYHAKEYGFPIADDDGLFERLILEINQAGLSWLTILKKRESFRRAYDHFRVESVAGYRARDKARLLRDEGIIRNRLKIDAAVTNARTILELRQRHGSFLAWLDAHHPRGRDEWVRLFRKTFVFTGGEITGEFLLSTGYLAGAHEESCPIYRKVLRAKPRWLR
ncbi:MAG TPA: DNA-3-methyladenine glycosylase I [Thermoanaerobaculia bacterium]|nr:DNA-3-methyladenine glycosylase I [Thermoanaerobaculia bacterium]